MKSMNECDIFTAALEIDSPEQRSAFLAETCVGDVQLQQRVQALLDSYANANSLLEHPAIDCAITELLGNTANTGGQTTPNEGDVSLDFLQPVSGSDALGGLGQYEVLEVVGRGGMGIVLKARDTKLQRIVAIKVLAPELAANPTARKRFLREAQAAAAVSHEHVVTIYAVDENGRSEHGHLPYLVMEFIDGQSLQQKLDRQGHLELKEVLRIGRQIASGLAAAHAQGMIHRDIKPSNILLQNGVERVQITDFGLARAVDDVGMTRTGEVAGTPQYMSPEQAQGLLVDVRSDLFSLGSVMYAMCTGRSPFRADTTIASLRRVCDDTPRPIREINPDVPDWLATLIERLLEKNPAQRFQTAGEVAELLGQHLAHIQAPGSSPLPKRVPPASSRGDSTRHSRWRLWQVAGLALLALAVGLGVTEATGVTHLSATVIRIVTGEGTLVIEVDDPTVVVSLDGEELSITGAGLQEVRLRPGQYQLQALRDGVPIRQELVTISRGDRQVVRVSLDGAPAATTPAATTTAAPVEPGAFVVLGGENVAGQKFDTLAEAILGSSAGDTIEIRGNGPFVMDAISITHPLTIRAGLGHQPVLVQSVETRQHALFAVHATLVLEGLELQRPAECVVGSVVATTHHGPPALFISNCRLVMALDQGGLLIWHRALHAEIRNSVLIGGDIAVDWNCRSGGSQVIENCVLAGAFGISYGGCDETDFDLHDVSITYRGNTVTGTPYGDIAVAYNSIPTIPEGVASIDVEVDRNIFTGKGPTHRVLHFAWLDQGETISDVLTAVQRLTSWQAQQNLCPLDADFLEMQVSTAPENLNPSPNEIFSRRLEPTAADDPTFWGVTEEGYQRGVIRFSGGDLSARKQHALDGLPLEQFRLRADSAGYQAGPDGEDLGANIDFVGPGAAYERWRQTPEYQQWLEESTRLMSSDGSDASAASIGGASSVDSEGAATFNN